MSSRTPSDGSSDSQAPEREWSASGAPEERPDWADGLRRLYDLVVEEPLPDAFKDLLDRLDTEVPSDDARDGPGTSDDGSRDGSDGGRA
ncbi:MAG: NepR family anti-sigma factor [Erythrobacter sp.]|jgi:hypothetical protein|nr:NepR family anti-sigma factor [Erythrobacter sp.]